MKSLYSIKIKLLLITLDCYKLNVNCNPEAITKNNDSKNIAKEMTRIFKWYTKNIYLRQKKAIIEKQRNKNTQDIKN